MFPGINPKKMQAVMRQMGISQEEIPAFRVIIEKEESKIVISNPSVVKVKMQGQETFQISGGDISEESLDTEISEEDIKTVMEKTGSTEEKAKSALEETGDLADAILKLTTS